MKEILYIPTGEIVKLFTGQKDEEGAPITVTAGKYISTGTFKEEFGKYDFFDKNRDIHDLFLAFLVGEIKDDEEIIFGAHIYDMLKIKDEDVDKLQRAEFELIER